VITGEYAENQHVRELLTALRLEWEQEIKDKMAQSVAQVRAATPA
jgi:hypothetical protein